MSIRLTRAELEKHWPEQAREILAAEETAKTKRAIASPVAACSVPILRPVEPGEVGPWVLTVPGWCPPSLNALIRKHWTAVTRAKRATNETILAACLLCRVPRADGQRRRVSLRLTLPKGRRAPDHDNMLKCLYDGLTSAGALVDDSPEWCQTGDYTVDRGKLETTIVLQDIAS